MPFHYDAPQTYHYYATNTENEDNYNMTQTISDGVNGLAHYTDREFHDGFKSVGYQMEELRQEFEEKLKEHEKKTYKIITEYAPLDISEEEFMAILEEG